MGSCRDVRALEAMILRFVLRISAISQPTRLCSTFGIENNKTIQRERCLLELLIRIALFHSAICALHSAFDKRKGPLYITMSIDSSEKQ